MSDEEQSNQSSPPQQPAGDSKSFTYGYNPRGDLVMDGVVVEKNTGPEAVGRPERLGPAPPDADEVEAVRRENADLRRQFEDAEPFLRISKDPILREILQEKIDRGEYEMPRAAPPEPEDVIGYKKRMAEPESAAILAAMQDYASTLPEHQAAELSSNHRTWCKTFDRFKQAGAGSLPRPPLPAAYPNVSMDRRTLAEIIKSKEVKNVGFVERPGPALPEYGEPDDDGLKEYGKAKSRLARARQEGTPRERDEAETRLVQAYFAERKPRRGGEY